MTSNIRIIQSSLRANRLYKDKITKILLLEYDNDTSYNNIIKTIGIEDSNIKNKIEKYELNIDCSCSEIINEYYNNECILKNNKLILNISNTIEKIKNQFIIADIKDVELLNYNLKNYNTIFYYRCLLQINNVKAKELNLIKRTKENILHFVNYIICNLGFENCADFKTIIHDKHIIQLETFLKNYYLYQLKNPHIIIVQ